MLPEPPNADPAQTPRGPEVELQARRESLRRGLRRANLASVLILAVVVTLATAVVWKAQESANQATLAELNAARASEEAGRAQEATERAEAELWNSRLNEVRAERYANRPGALIGNRRRLRELTQRPGLSEEQLLALRQEAIAQMAAMDIELPTVVATNRNSVGLTWDASLERYFWKLTNGVVEVRAHPRGDTVCDLRGPIGAQAQAMVFSPDGTRAAVRYHGGEVRVWEIGTTNLLLTTRCVRVRDSSTPLMFMPGGGTLAMFTSEGFALQRIERGSLPRVLQKGRAIDGAAFTPDGRTLAALPLDNVKVVEIWDVERDVVTLRFEPGARVNGVEWHPDGRRLALLGERGQVSLWELRSALGGTEGYPQEAVRFLGHLGTIVYFQFTPDGSKLLTHSWDTTSRFWEVISGRELYRETRVTLNAIDQTGSRVVGQTPDGRLDMVCRLEMETAFRTFATAGGPRAAQGVWISPDQRLVAIGYPAEPDEKTGEVRLWDFENRVELGRVPGIWAQFSPDSRTLYAFAFGGLRRFDVSRESLARRPSTWTTGTMLYQPERGVSLNTGQISDDGSRITIAAMDRVIQIDVESGEPVGGFKALAHYVSPSRDGRTMALMFQNQPATLRDAETGRVLGRSRSFGRGMCSPDTNWIAVAEHDGVRVFRYPALERIFDARLELGTITPPPVTFSPDSRMLAVADNRTDIRLHEIPSGRVLAVLSPPNPSQIAGGHGIEFSQDGRWLIFARDGGDIVGWDLFKVRQQLKELGLDWDAPASPAPLMPLAGAATTVAPPSVRQRVRIEVVTLAATMVTLVAGVFVFVVQRRLLRSYERAEALAQEQRRRLDSAQSELMHGQKMRALGTLAAGIAHDFNNLLSVIRLSNQLAAEQTKPTGVAKENVDAIETAVTQGESIVQSMLGYSRAAAEQEGAYEVDASVNETVAMLGRKFLAGIILKLEIAKELPAVQGSRGRLEQVLLNLIVNASEAMNGKGTLRLSARPAVLPVNCLLKPRPAARYVEIEVGDSGPGIPPEVLARMFEPFFTTKTLGTRPGTGLGLATVYTMAEQDGMGLAVTTAVGQGTTFRIFVPAAEEEAAP